MHWLKKIYWEDEEAKYCPSPSYCEVVVFCIGFILTLVFVVVVCRCGFEWRHLSLLLPALLWIFMRASRKNMTATGNMIAGSIGAIIGALVVYLARGKG